MIVPHSFVNIDIAEDHHGVHYYPLVDKCEKVHLLDFQEDPGDWKDWKAYYKDSFLEKPLVDIILA